MLRFRMWRLCPMLAAMVLGVCSVADAQLPASTLSVFDAGSWKQWWRSDQAPADWRAPDSLLTSALQWRELQPGLELAQLHLAGAGEAWRTGVVVVRIDPSRFTFRLTGRVRKAGGESPWTIADAPPEAAIAFNVGQFQDAVPWGWVVRGYREIRRPGTGPLAAAVLVGDSLTIVPAESIAAVRANRLPREAFQSYPALLSDDGRVHLALRDSGRGIDVAHRDSRLALGTLRDGRILVALTRFEALRGALSQLPFGITTPEMAAIMGALGAQRAVMLDGGISAQLLVRDSVGAPTTWRGLRRVPLGLIGIPRAPKK